MITKELKFADGSRYPLMGVTESQAFFENVSRRTLQFTFDPQFVSYEEIDRIFADGGRTGKLTIIVTSEQPDEKNQMQVNVDEYVHDGYVHKIASAKNREETRRESYEGPAEYRETITVEMAQLSYSERMLRESNESVNTLTELLADYIGGAI